MICDWLLVNPRWVWPWIEETDHDGTAPAAVFCPPEDKDEMAAELGRDEDRIAPDFVGHGR